MAAAEMDDLADRYAHRGVTSVFVYTREAHPAEHYREHTSMQVKRGHARAFQEHGAVQRRILLDDLEGTVHRAYGLLPNMSFIVHRGQILYKAAWTIAADIEQALHHALGQIAQRREQRLAVVYTERAAWRKDTPDAFRAGLERAGPQAVGDFYDKS